MSAPTFTAWAHRLRQAAAATPGSAPPDGAFADELGHRRAVDAPFLTWRARAAGGAPGALPAPGGAALDVLLWHAVLDAAAPVEPLIGAAAGEGPAPVIRPDTYGAIEVWTEAELGALHALWRLARLRGRPDLIGRCLRAARWHVEHVQPDNATNHPWAVHVFIIAAARTGLFEYDLHAQAMLHNCQVSLGRPDALSSHILVDAAECLEIEARGAPG